MGRRVVGFSAAVLVAMALAGCGGGGTGSSGSGISPNRMTLTVDSLRLVGDQSTTFTVTVTNRNGGPMVGVAIEFSQQPVNGLEINVDDDVTNANGQVIGIVRGLTGGTHSLQASAPSEGLTDSKNIFVDLPPNIRTPTRTPGGPPPPTVTGTAVPAAEVKTIFMETNPLAISAAKGADVTVSAIAFDQNNQPINGVELLFDFSPRIGTLSQVSARTAIKDGQAGIATVVIHVEPDVAAPGSVTVTSTAAGVTGEVTFVVVSGSAPKPVSTVLLQSDVAACGADVGGSVTLNATVFDADNNPINGVNVLFTTEVGEVIPLTDQTMLVGSQNGRARTTLQITAGTLVRRDTQGNISPYLLTARAGGVEGRSQIFVVPGRQACSGVGGGEPGEAASVVLSGSPTKIRVRGSGRNELANVTATVFDNNGNRRALSQVRFSIPSTSVAAGAILLPVNTNPLGTCAGSPETPCTSDVDCADGEICVLTPSDRFTVVTDRAGNAQIQVRSGIDLGTVTVQAEVPTTLEGDLSEPCINPSVPGERCVISRSTLVTVTSGQAGRVSLVINRLAVDNNDGSMLTTMSAIVSDTRGNIVEDGTPVFFEVLPFNENDADSRLVALQGFSVTNGDPPCDVSRFGSQTGEQVTPQPGDAITCVKFPPNRGGTEVQIRVEAGRSDVAAVATVTLPGIIDNLLTSLPPTVRVTTEEPGVVLLTAVTLDDLGNRLPNVRLTFETNVGTFTSRPPGFLFDQRTDADGIATATLTIPAGTPAGNADIRIWGGGITRPILPTGRIEITSSGNTGQVGEPSSVVFLAASPPTIGVAGSGLPNQSILTFKVTDPLNTPLEGVTVNFFLNGIGGEILMPAQAETDEEGVARVSVASGTRAAPVQVSATVDIDGDNSPDLAAQSTALNIVGAPPTFKRFSLAAEFLNIAGRVTFGLEDEITALLNDRFGNAPPPGTVVNFLTNGASVVSQTTTGGDGRAVTTLLSEDNIPPNGVVTILAMTRGEEPFTDVNGNGRYDVGEPYISIPEPFIDANGNEQFDPPEPFTDSNNNGRHDEGEPFTDTNQNTRYDANDIELFVDINNNMIWDAEQNPDSGPAWEGNAMIWKTSDVTFSGHTFIDIEPSTFSVDNGGSATFSVYVGDAFGNPLVGGSRVAFEAVGPGADGVEIIPSAVEIPDTETFGFPALGVNVFIVRLFDGDDGSRVFEESVGLQVAVTSASTGTAPGGNGSVSTTVFGTLEPIGPTPTAQPTPTPTDTPTFTVTPTPTITPTATDSPSPTNTPVPRSLAFVGAQPQSIGVRGSGLPEQSTLTYKVTDDLANPVGGVRVQFSLTAVGGESIVPLEGVTNAEGLVQTVLTSGTSAVSVRVNARTVVDPGVFAQSTAVSIVGAPPVADRFSLAAQFLNISGRVTFGIEDTITAFLNDRFGNAVPPGTAVSFTTNGGSIVNPLPTDSRGKASGVLISEGGSIPPNGIIDILATTQGEEPFVDTNGNGGYDPGEPFTDIPEPFIDRNGNDAYDPSDPFERFVDTNNNNVWDAAQGSGVWNEHATIWAMVSVTFSGPTNLTLTPSSFVIPEGGRQSFVLTIADDLGNPIVGGSQVQISLTGSQQALLAGVPATFTLPDAETSGQIVDGVNRFHFDIVDSQPGMGSDEPVIVSVTLTSSGLPAGGNGSRNRSASGQIGGVPTPVPTATATIPGPTATVTPTGQLPPTATSAPEATPTSTPIPTVTPTAGTAASIQFVGASPPSVGVKGSGLAEQSVLTFRVTDPIGSPVIGAPVNFTITGVGSETVTPESATTGAGGLVTTTLTSGTRATTIRVTATTGALFAQSTAVSVVGAPPSKNRFSLAAERLNVAGRIRFGIENEVSVFVNDRFGNAVPSGTAISFFTNGASIVEPSVTATNGVATATLLTEGEIAPTGIVTVLAFTRGEESFLDNNGNGIFDAGDTITSDNVPEPFVDYRGLPPALNPSPSPENPVDTGCVLSPPSALCNNLFDPGLHFELFVDTQPLNGVWNPQGGAGVWDDNILVFGTIPITFSGPLVTPVVTPTGFDIPNGGAQGFVLEVHDDLLNPLVGGSTINITSTAGTVIPASITIPDGSSFNRLVNGLTRFSFVLQDADPTDTEAARTATITVSIASDNGNGGFVVASGSLD